MDIINHGGKGKQLYTIRESKIRVLFEPFQVSIFNGRNQMIIFMPISGDVVIYPHHLNKKALTFFFNHYIEIKKLKPCFKMIEESKQYLLN